MTAFNVVRFRVKPGRDEEFLAAHRKVNRSFPGMRRFSLFKSGEGAYCVVGEWQSFKHLANARPQMIGILDSFRDCLDELGGGLGVTDPVSGEALVDLKPKAKKNLAKKAPKKKTPPKKAPKRKAAKKSRR